MQNYEPDVTQLLGLYQQLEDDIVADMVRRMLCMGFVSETTAYQAEVLQTAGILYDDILQMIANRTDASVAQVRAMFEDAGVRTVEIDNDTHEAAGEAPADIRQDGGMKQVLDAGYRKTLGTMRNLVSTTANTTQTAFLQACDRAYMQVSSGAFSYQDAIRMAVRNLADGGAYVTYPTGHRDRIGTDCGGSGKETCGGFGLSVHGTDGTRRSKTRARQMAGAACGDKRQADTKGH